LKAYGTALLSSFGELKVLGGFNLSPRTLMFELKIWEGDNYLVKNLEKLGVTIYDSRMHHE